MLSRTLSLIFGVAVLFLSGLPACSKSQTMGETHATNANAASGSNSSSSPVAAVSQTLVTPAQSRVVFILDASGSMLGRVGQEEKMVVARRVLKESIVKLPDAAEVGLIAYGHRRKNDCADIEVLSQLKTIDKPALQAQIDALKPSGMTSITNSLQQAFEIVRSQQAGGPVTVVLVSDGLETCNGDPCKLAAERRSQV